MIHYSKEDLIKEMKRYDDKINGEHLRKLKKSNITMWQLQFGCFMGHKFRLMNMIQEIDNDTKVS